MVADTEVKAAEAAATAAAAAPLKADLNSLPIRSYLDQTVVPLLLQGMAQLVCVCTAPAPSPSPSPSPGTPPPLQSHTLTPHIHAPHTRATHTHCTQILTAAARSAQPTL